ncbi:MAG TPA: hypothetical protein PLD20_01105 [Blastocatellia bacterium]|nr:hypothetical protein [Blastocatellia bacterium]HMV86605.1 hypothetical protein [Blastocatellia bacterium]HMX29101.1 hypothetical protein [Blastocatellia bacterium]HMY70720.1 hypothetical protein [Blastocatellia bacterium]HMZ16534.1 hypothetical protein [Blastocatellia bacterium]
MKLLRRILFRIGGLLLVAGISQALPNFKNSWFAVTRPNTEHEAMGEYLPYVLNLHDKARFEALGCPVDKRKPAAMIRR